MRARGGGEPKLVLISLLVALLMFPLVALLMALLVVLLTPLLVALLMALLVALLPISCLCLSYIKRETYRERYVERDA